MNARHTAAADALTQAIRRAATGSTVRCTAWTRPADAQALAESIDLGSIGAHSVTDAESAFYFMADLSEADGPDVVR